MENNKEVKNIADHQEQHHAGASPPQEYLAKRVDNPLQPPQPQQQQLAASGTMDGDGGESKQRPKTKEDYNWDPERCCCWGPGCFRRVLIENYDECCCTNVCVSICLFLALVICSCRNRC